MREYCFSRRPMIAFAGLGGNNMDRRGFLRFGAVMTTGLAGGCAWAERPIPGDDSGPEIDLIDAHCHVFNGSDLPMVRFVTQVVFKNYPEESKPRIMESTLR